MRSYFESLIRIGFNVDAGPNRKYIDKFTWKIFLINIFWSKFPIYLSLGLNKNIQATRRKSSSLIREHPAPKLEISSLLWVIFAILNPDPARPKWMRIYADPDQQHCNKVRIRTGSSPMAAVARGPTSPLAFLRWERRDSYTRKKVQKLGTSLPNKRTQIKEFFDKWLWCFLLFLADVSSTQGQYLDIR